MILSGCNNCVQVYVKNVDALEKMAATKDEDRGTKIDPTEAWSTGKDVTPLNYPRVESWGEYAVSDECLNDVVIVFNLCKCCSETHESTCTEEESEDKSRGMSW